MGQLGTKTYKFIGTKKKLTGKVDDAIIFIDEIFEAFKHGDVIEIQTGKNTMRFIRFEDFEAKVKLKAIHMMGDLFAAYKTKYKSGL